MGVLTPAPISWESYLGIVGASGCPWLEQEEEAEEVRVSGARGWEGDWPGAPDAQCPSGCRASLFVRVVRWPPPLRFAAGAREAEGGFSPASAAPAAPTPPGRALVRGGARRRGLAARPAHPARRLQPGRLLRPPPLSGSRCRGHSGAPAGCAHPCGTGLGARSGWLRNPASASASRRRPNDRFLFLSHGFRKRILKFSSRIWRS